MILHEYNYEFMLVFSGDNFSYFSIKTYVVGTH